MHLEVDNLREKLVKQNDYFTKEMDARGTIQRKHVKQIKDLREEILMAKRILKDPRLSLLATRKFNALIDKENEEKFMLKSALVTDIIKKQDEQFEVFECELLDAHKLKLPEGKRMKMDHEVDS